MWGAGHGRPTRLLANEHLVHSLSQAPLCRPGCCLLEKGPDCSFLLGKERPEYKYDFSPNCNQALSGRACHPPSHLRLLLGLSGAQLSPQHPRPHHQVTRPVHTSVLRTLPSSLCFLLLLTSAVLSPCKGKMMSTSPVTTSSAREGRHQARSMLPRSRAAPDHTDSPQALGTGCCLASVPGKQTLCQQSVREALPLSHSCQKHSRYLILRRYLIPK